MLLERNMRDNESSQEYFLKIQNLCSLGNIEDSEFISYEVKQSYLRNNAYTIVLLFMNLNIIYAKLRSDSEMQQQKLMLGLKFNVE